ncbi:hypothetical protein ACA910_016425 [Epithemia clementina (nom. ined.)]
MRCRNIIVASILASSVAAVRRPTPVAASIRNLGSGSSSHSSHLACRQHNIHQITSTYVTSYQNVASCSTATRRRKRTRIRSGSESESSVQLCSVAAGASTPAGRSISATLMRGAFLRIASDLSGGTAFESVKCRVAATTENAAEALRGIVQNGGVTALWSGTPSRTVEGALVGSLFMLSSTVVKAQIKAIGGGPAIAALGGGLIGGIAQALIMTPCGLVFTSLNVNRGKPGHENDNAFSVAKQIIQDRGLAGLYFGFQPMAMRQASNWASRAGFTEIARSVLGLQRYGVIGEIGSGVLGGLGSCWNTPIETIRVLTQRDVSYRVPGKTMKGYWNEIVERDGYPGLFRGITPRAFQAVWQTCFMVVVPNIIGI